MEFLIYIITALWLGILTSISPCPLASNIAAFAYLSGKLKDKKLMFISTVLYSFGRAVVYTLLAFAAVKSAQAIPGISEFMQRYMNKVLGFLLILIGMFLAGLISFKIPVFYVPEKAKKGLSKGGPAGAFMLGMLFALSMCPVSAAIFFGSLIPLAIKAQSPLVMPLIYGLGTALPIAVFSLLAASGAGYMAKMYKKTIAFEKHAQTITGVIIILTGVYFVLHYVFNII